jgi:hypothetical protein
MTLVDTSVLLDVLLEGSAHGKESERRLSAAQRSGSLSVNAIIAAELGPSFASEADLWSALTEASIELVAFPKEAAYVAGQAFLRYRRRGGKRERILPDFLIGAHALVEGMTLLTRDRGFYRDYFPKLRTS